MSIEDLMLDGASVLILAACFLYAQRTRPLAPRPAVARVRGLRQRRRHPVPG
jgi:hypothetical protein